MCTYGWHCAYARLAHIQVVWGFPTVAQTFAIKIKWHLFRVANKPRQTKRQTDKEGQSDRQTDREQERTQHIPIHLAPFSLLLLWSLEAARVAFGVARLP